MANSLAMQKSYERELARLPKGSLVKKTISPHISPWVGEFCFWSNSGHEIAG
jgi:hypothetical protein